MNKLCILSMAELLKEADGLVSTIREQALRESHRAEGLRQMGASIIDK